MARSSPGHLFLAYALSFVCDELDGRFARQLSQTSTFGVVLDMVTDRVATSCLLSVLCMLYPRAHLGFLTLMGLDIFSHWFQMYATLAAGAISHKDVRSSSAVVRFYYRSRLFMGFCCICCEVLYLCLYLLAWPRYQAAAPVTVPGALAALLPGLALTPRGDAAPAAAVVALVALPGVVIKQAVNVVQLRTAARQLVQLDRSRDARRAG